MSRARTSSRLPAKFSRVRCSVQGLRQLKRCCQGHGRHLPDNSQMKRVSSHPSLGTSQSISFRCQLSPARQRKCAPQVQLGAHSGAQTTQFRRVPTQIEIRILGGILEKFHRRSQSLQHPRFVSVVSTTRWRCEASVSPTSLARK